MKVQVMEITPAKAREWLQGNESNRRVRQIVVERYKRDMEAGVWLLNGEPIILNGDRVLSGQHRLLACIAAGVSFRSVVVRDAPEEVMGTIDQGVSRNLGDVLRWKGYNQEMRLAGAIRSGWRWDNGLLLRPFAATSAEAIAWLEANPGIVSATQFAARVSFAPVKLRASIGGPVYLKASKAEGDAADEFFDRLLDGEHISHGDAVYALRKTLVTNAMKTGFRFNQNQMHSFTIKAWNAWVTGTPVDKLYWRRGGPKGERFPVMVDSSGNAISAEQ